jgi:hypothetical protein
VVEHWVEVVEPSETRVVTSPEERARVQVAMQEAPHHLRRVAPNAPTRRLELALDLFRRTVEAWGESPPTDAQLGLIRDHIVEALHLTRQSRFACDARPDQQ